MIGRTVTTNISPWTVTYKIVFLPQVMPDMKTAIFLNVFIQATQALTHFGSRLRPHHTKLPFSYCVIRYPFQLGPQRFASMSKARATSMSAVVVHKAGGPEVLQLEKRSVPKAVWLPFYHPYAGRVLTHVCRPKIKS